MTTTPIDANERLQEAAGRVWEAVELLMPVCMPPLLPAPANSLLAGQLRVLEHSALILSAMTLLPGS